MGKLFSLPLLLLTFAAVACAADADTKRVDLISDSLSDAARPGEQAELTGTKSDLEFSRDARPFLDTYCAKCHNAEKAKGGINLDLFTDEVSLYRHRTLVNEVIGQLQHREMPPKDAKQPEDAARTQLAEWLTWKLANVDYARFRNPGFMPSHRLTRRQYRNTIRDLIGVGMEAADDLPTDEATHGFDHIGDVQDVSAVHLEKYLVATNYILDRVFVPAAKTWTLDPRKMEYVRHFGLSGNDEKITFPADAPDHEITDRAHVIYYTGGVVFSHAFPDTGVYRFKLRVWGGKALHAEQGPKLSLKLDATEVAGRGVPTGGPEKIEVADFKTVVRAGRHDVKFEMENMGVSANATDLAQRLNRVGIESIEIVGPIVENESQAKTVLEGLLVARPGGELTPREAARRVLDRFAARAFRRPVTSSEVDGLLSFYDRASKRSDSYENSIKLALKAALMSPNFLFHLEQDRDTHQAYRIGDFELANRLSYFLWSSMPDDELFVLAAQGTLHEPEVLHAQTLRMLKDAKSRVLAQSFAPQWLGLGSLYAVAREGNFHTDRGARRMLEDEVVNFFDYLIRENRPITELLNADYTFANESLAKHYGLKDVKGSEFRKVALTGEIAKQRGGVLGMSAVYLSVSHPKDTNPSGRGKWVLDVLLGTPPPPPPPDVPLLPKEEKDAPKLTLRERLSQHRADPNCASCHAKIDPIGFALENYDNVGAWRAQEAGKQLDVSGEMPGGTTINGPDDLRKYLVAEKRDLFRHHLVERLLTFALRRSLEFYDEGPVREISSAIAKEGDGATALVVAIVKSYPFQFRQNPGMKSVHK